MGRTLAQGTDFAGYRIERLLGVGGMGEVYLAHDRDLPRFVALKLLNQAMTHEEGVRERFQREADTAARLSHPNIVAVYARGQHDDRLWIAMEYIDGTDVAAVLRAGPPLHPGHAVRIIAEAARALDHAHHTGFLHRDVKPANILLARGAQERVLLADFGIAKALDESAALTRTGELFASLQYAAPEQFDSKREIDRRADVYALGCTLYHMLTGVIPYPGMNSAQLINAHLNLPVPRPTQQNPALPLGFDAVIARAMAKDPQYRFGSCGELAAAAGAALAGAHVPPPPIPAPRKPRGRAPMIIALAVGLVLAVSGAGVAIALAVRSSSDSSGQQVEDAEAARTKTQDAACAIMRTLITYDYNTLDAYRKAVDESTTGDFRKDFDGTWDVLRQSLVETRISSQPTDIQCFYKTGDANRAEVAVIANQTTTGAAGPNATQISVIMTLTKVDGRWLCSKLESTQPPK